MVINDSFVINNVIVAHLTNEYKLEYFCCGNNDMDNFLKNCALTEQKDKLSMTYLVFLDSEVAGFFSANF